MTEAINNQNAMNTINEVQYANHEPNFEYHTHNKNDVGHGTIGGDINVKATK